MRMKMILLLFKDIFQNIQNLTGKLLIQTKSKKNTVVFNGFYRLYSNIKCQGQMQ
jgi:hypothetical protein